MEPARVTTGAREVLRNFFDSVRPFIAPLSRWNLYIGGGGSVVDGYINLDLFLLHGVDVVADAASLPFAASTFRRVECDAVREHVRRAPGW